MPEFTENQEENAAQVVLTINSENHRVKQVDTEVSVNIEMLYGNELKPSSYSVSEVAYEGSLGFHGDVAGDITPKLTQEDGISPRENNTLTVSHADGTFDRYENVFMTQVSYSMSENDTTETTYEWVAMDGQLAQDA